MIPLDESSPTPQVSTKPPTMDRELKGKLKRQKPLKKSQAKVYRAVIVPRSGDPYPADVEENDAGVIEFNGKSWVVSHGSVWIDGGKRRIILPEITGKSMSGSSLNGTTLGPGGYMDAAMFFRHEKMRLLGDILDLQGKPPWYKQASTWIGVGALFLMAVLIFWAVITIGDGFDRLAESLNNLNVGGAGSSGSSSHNPIAPKPGA